MSKRGYFVYGNREEASTPALWSDILPNAQATQKCQDQHAAHTYQQDISNHCPVARQKELPESQEHLRTENVLDGTMAPPQAPTPSKSLLSCAEGKLRFPRGRHVETNGWERSGRAAPRMDRQAATETPKTSTRLQV